MKVLVCGIQQERASHSWYTFIPFRPKKLLAQFTQVTWLLRSPDCLQTNRRNRGDYQWPSVLVGTSSHRLSARSRHYRNQLCASPSLQNITSGRPPPSGLPPRRKAQESPSFRKSCVNDAGAPSRGCVLRDTLPYSLASVFLSRVSSAAAYTHQNLEGDRALCFNTLEPGV